MTSSCTYIACDPSLGCNLGELRPEDCSHWQLAHKTSGPIADDAANADSEVRLPWTGQVLGLHDLRLLSGRARPLLVGLVGPQGAGKTTLLAALALLVGRGLVSDDWCFAGSLTLASWRQLTTPLQWQADAAPTFPPHTSLNSGRIPGLLHFAMRRTDGEVRDLLFADAPGEWFARWAVMRDDPAAEGARWVVQHADALLLFADQAALSGPQRGAARTMLVDLGRRLQVERADRPLALIWTKSDLPVNEQVRAGLEDYFAQVLAPHQSFHTTISAPVSQASRTNQIFLDFFAWLLELRPAARRGIAPLASPDPVDPFWAYRGR